MYIHECLLIETSDKYELVEEVKVKKGIRIRMDVPVRIKKASLWKPTSYSTRDVIATYSIHREGKWYSARYTSSTRNGKLVAFILPSSNLILKWWPPAYCVVTNVLPKCLGNLIQQSRAPQSTCTHGIKLSRRWTTVDVNSLTTNYRKTQRETFSFMMPQPAMSLGDGEVGRYTHSMKTAWLCLWIAL